MVLKLGRKERELLDSMEKRVSVKEAAQAIKMDPGTANRYLYRLRKKLANADLFGTDMRARSRRSKLVAKCLINA